MAKETFRPGDLYRVTHNNTLWWISDTPARSSKYCRAVCVRHWNVVGVSGQVTDIGVEVTSDQIIIARGLDRCAADAAGALL